MSAPTPDDLFFAYGTLMRGAGGPWAARLEAMGGLLGRGSVAGRLFRVSWYPGMVEADGPGQRVQGEVWRLADPGRAWRCSTSSRASSPASRTSRATAAPWWT